VNQLFRRSSGVTVFLGDLAQRHDRILVVVALDRDLLAGRHHAGAMTRQQHEIETILYLIDAILDGDAAPSSGPPQILVRGFTGAIPSTCLQGK